MNFYTDDSPIIACSTGINSNTAIAVIRLSGFKSLLLLQPFFSFLLSKTKARTSHLTNIKFDNQVLDNGLMVFFPEGESYTGENVLELSVHGNLLNVQRILDLFINKAHFRSAHPGEFTYRALKNKKLSLSQVEGLDMLLNANSNLMLSQGLDILQGDLHAQYMHLYDSFLKLKASVELSIDFSEDIGEAESNILINESFKKFQSLILALYSRIQGNISSILSPEIVLVGQTNAGKSSLFNLLVKHNRSIVSSIAGTTRDYVSEIIHIEGTNYNLIDTAGIRDSLDEIENIGIERAFEILKRSFFKILIINPFETNPAYLEKLAGEKFDFLIISHSDQPQFLEAFKKLNLNKLLFKDIVSASFTSGSIGPDLKSGSIGPDLKSGPSGSIGPDLKSGPSGSIGPGLKSGPIGSIGPDLKSGSIGPSLKSGPSGSIGPSLKSGPSGSIGPDSFNHFLEDLIKKSLVDKFSELTANNPILLERHRSCINNIYLKTQDFSSKINEISDVAILSSEVNILSHHLSDLIGIISPDDVLNSIFANFCIGK